MSLSADGNGCDVWHDCFTCPLPKCKYELEPGQAKAIIRALILLASIRPGENVGTTADRLGWNRRTAYRLYKQHHALVANLP